jgi:hypothetical protein
MDASTSVRPALQAYVNSVYASIVHMRWKPCIYWCSVMVRAVGASISRGSSHTTAHRIEFVTGCEPRDVPHRRFRSPEKILRPVRTQTIPGRESISSQRKPAGSEALALRVVYIQKHGYMKLRKKIRKRKSGVWFDTKSYHPPLWCCRSGIPEYHRGDDVTCTKTRSVP